MSGSRQTGCVVDEPPQSYDTVEISKVVARQERRARRSRCCLGCDGNKSIDSHATRPRETSSESRNLWSGDRSGWEGLANANLFLRNSFQQVPSGSLFWFQLQPFTLAQQSSERNGLPRLRWVMSVRWPLASTPTFIGFPAVATSGSQGARAFPYIRGPLIPNRSASHPGLVFLHNQSMDHQRDSSRFQLHLPDNLIQSILAHGTSRTFPTLSQVYSAPSLVHSEQGVDPSRRTNERDVNRDSSSVGCGFY